MIRILQINTTLNWGSTGRIAEEIGQLVIAEGGESYIAYGRYANSTQSKALRIGNKWDIYCHILLTRLLDKHGDGSKRATKMLIKQINNIQPNIIHLHNIHGYYINYSILFKYLASVNIPVVWTLHDCWAFTGHCSHYTFYKCYKWQKHCTACPQIERYPSSWGKDGSEQNYKKKKKYFCSLKNMTIVPVSDWLSHEVSKSFLNRYPIKRIYNGIDIDKFKSISNNYDNVANKFVILGVANVWDSRKGLSDFILLREKLSTDYTIILIGLSEKQIKELPDGIEGIERTNTFDELVKYYSVADVFVNFSVEETFGLTTCEALACGTPAIVYNITACPEIIDKDTGFIVEPGDFEGVIKAINEIRLNGKGTYTEACRKRVELFFNKKDRYVEYLQLYKDIINSR